MSLHQVILFEMLIGLMILIARTHTQRVTTKHGFMSNGSINLSI